ncbi:carbohydrate ABC transporter permease [Paenibacillus silviterrae]|uniref:carbohydrate ABC transporter permease n=1 Tax=Paenibacillus silviterrae TaxID=3242194 RepID=UPI0025427852|nr:carbohydrate ABC transporter permease [Paenibacillus chinjuensis]
MRKKQFSLFDLFNVSLISLFSIAVIYPFWQTFVLSFSNADDASALGFHIWPSRWVTDAYQFVFTYQNILVAYLNTIVRTTFGTLLIVASTLLVAYPLSKKDLPFRNFFTAFFLITMFFSGGLIPNYLLIKNLGLLDNQLALILPGAVNVFSIIVMRNYLMTIDKGLEESAFMDGAGYFKILTQIMIPLSKPVIATVALWAAVGHWNAWFDAMIYIRDPSKTVLQMVVRQMMVALDLSQTQFGGGGGMANADLLLSNVRAATVMISIGPIILVYPFAQKYFIKGIMIGSLKG